jgi:PKD repeat protein
VGASCTPSQPNVGEVVTCTATASSGASIQNYNWNLGEGTTQTGQTASHAYGASGAYTVTLTVADTSGETAQASTQVTVKPGGVWISPCATPSGQAINQSGNGCPDAATASGIIYFSAKAYPTHLVTDPQIAYVNFTVNMGGGWGLACTATIPDINGYYSCTWNPFLAGAQLGTLQVSFDVYDQQRNVNNSPNGEHRLLWLGASTSDSSFSTSPCSPPADISFPESTQDLLARISNGLDIAKLVNNGGFDLNAVSNYTHDYANGILNDVGNLLNVSTFAVDDVKLFNLSYALGSAYTNIVAYNDTSLQAYNGYLSARIAYARGIIEAVGDDTFRWIPFEGLFEATCQTFVGSTLDDAAAYLANRMFYKEDAIVVAMLKNGNR